MVGVERVYPGSPAERAGIEAGDVILGPPGHPFTWANEIRQWTMLTPLHEPRELELLRNGETVTISIEFDPYPSRLPK
jgi:serine protease Do